MDFWYGQSDGTPLFVLARTAPEIESVVAIGGSGRHYPLTMSAVIQQFGLRFGATPIPDDDELVEVRTVPPSSVHPVLHFPGAPASARQS